MEELIFAYVDSVSNGAPIKQQKITFTNEYEVKLLINHNNEIEKILIEPTESLFENLYPRCIKNINLLVGMNGSGKTTLFNILGSSRDKRKQNIEEWKFFFLYKVDKNRFVIEGNNLSVIRGIKEIKHFLFSSKGGVSPEYSLVFEYDFEQKEINNIRMCNPGDGDNTQILYYQDLSTRVCQWSVDRSQDYEDYEIFVKRKKILPSIKALYEYINYVLDMPFSERNGLLNTDEMELRISFNDGFNYPWKRDKISKEDYGKNYLLATAIYLVKYCFYYTNMEECRKLVENLENAMDSNRFLYTQNWMDEVQLAIEQQFKTNNIEEAINLLNNLRRAINSTQDCWFLGDNFNWLGGTLETIFFRVQKNYMNDVANVLQAMDEINVLSRDFYNLKVDKLSSGETKVLDVFSSISANVKAGKKHYIIVLDEPDKGLHPEMSRGFIQNLIRHMEILNKQYNCTFQFIISTHSPFFISDVPKNNIHCLIRKDDCVEITNSEMGLLSSIPDIMRNTFFLESPFGNVANHYFKKLQNQIMLLSENSELWDGIEHFQRIIEELDDLTVKMFLRQALEEKLHEIGRTDRKAKEQLIEYHMKEIQRLRGVNND